MRYLLPLGLFIVLVILLAVGLTLNPRDLPSPLVDKPAPTFSLPQLDDPGKMVSPEQFRGKPWILNVWASWCVSCRVEHPLLMEFAKKRGVILVGLNYRDERADALKWLEIMGNPYTLSVRDAEGRVGGVEYGAYGVPETFVIDGMGIIRYRLAGPLTEEILQNKILPLIQ